MVDVLIRVTIQAHSKDPPRFPPPFRYPRPGAKPEPEERLSRAAVRAAMLRR